MQNFGMYTTQNQLPLYAQQGYVQGYNQGLMNSSQMPTYTNPSLFMNTGYMQPMVGGCFDTFGGMPMIGGYGNCCCDCGSDDSMSGFGKGLLIGGGIALGVGLIIKFAKPIGNFLGTVGKGLWSGIKWAGGMIGKGAKAAWNGIKWAGGKIAQGAKWVWEHTLGKLFKKKAKAEKSE